MKHIFFAIVNIILWTLILLSATLIAFSSHLPEVLP